ncbi:MAG: peptide-methionine (R)-S-oxide reductase MsrB [Anaerovoracaceae bacterium]
MKKFIDNNYLDNDNKVIYLAGGCFWGMEKLMSLIPGVLKVISGYANGKIDIIPSYDNVISGKTGYKETVRVEYDPSKVSLQSILSTYYYVIDPTVFARQGNDRGTQYQTGIYYIDDESKHIVDAVTSKEKERYSNFYVETQPLTCFYNAEEYHQNYLNKNPNGYCHISPQKMSEATAFLVDSTKYSKPSIDDLKSTLTDIQYRVTQNGETEAPFSGEYEPNQQDGLYVDITTGEPLFSSKDKYQSSCGWPAFTKGIDPATLRKVADNSLCMTRTEVRSRIGNAHLGHVFYGDFESPNGIRYCINSAALKFIPYDDMDKNGYGMFKKYIK